MDYAARRMREILEAMESYRARNGDLNDPQFAELAAALGENEELLRDSSGCDGPIS